MHVYEILGNRHLNTLILTRLCIENLFSKQSKSKIAFDWNKFVWFINKIESRKKAWMQLEHTKGEWEKAMTNDVYIVFDS